MKLSDVIKIWDELQKNTGVLRYSVLRKAVENTVGIGNDTPTQQPEAAKVPLAVPRGPQAFIMETMERLGVSWLKRRRVFCVIYQPERIEWKRFRKKHAVSSIVCARKVAQAIDEDTLKGLLLSPGDWLVKENDGDFHFCQAAVFAVTYEEETGTKSPDVLREEASRKPKDKAPDPFAYMGEWKTFRRKILAVIRARRVLREMNVHTPPGFTHHCHPGDWLIEVADNVLRPCHPKNFNKIWEEVK